MPSAHLCSMCTGRAMHTDDIRRVTELLRNDYVIKVLARSLLWAWSVRQKNHVASACVKGLRLSLLARCRERIYDGQ